MIGGVARLCLSVLIVLGVGGCQSVSTVRPVPDELSIGGELAGEKISPEQWAQVVGQASRSVYKVQVLSCEGKELGSGTGFQVAKWVVTNRHVVANAEKIELIGPGGDVFRVEGWSYLDRPDIALLEINLPSKSVPALDVYLGYSTPGDVVAAIGHPLGGDLEIRTGRITSGVLEEEITQDTAKNPLYHSVIIQPGDSGGPVVNSKGQVIGVSTAIALRQDLAVAVPASELLELLSDANDLSVVSGC